MDYLEEMMNAIRSNYYMGPLSKEAAGRAVEAAVSGQGRINESAIAGEYGLAGQKVKGAFDLSGENVKGEYGVAGEKIKGEYGVDQAGVQARAHLAGIDSQGAWQLKKGMMEQSAETGRNTASIAGAKERSLIGADQWDYQNKIKNSQWDRRNERTNQQKIDAAEKKDPFHINVDPVSNPTSAGGNTFNQKISPQGRIPTFQEFLPAMRAAGSKMTTEDMFKMFMEKYYRKKQ